MPICPTLKLYLLSKRQMDTHPHVLFRISKLLYHKLHIFVLPIGLRVKLANEPREAGQNVNNSIGRCASWVCSDHPRRPRSWHWANLRPARSRSMLVQPHEQQTTYEASLSSVYPRLSCKPLPHERAGCAVVNGVDEAMNVVVHYSAIAFINTRRFSLACQLSLSNWVSCEGARTLKL